MIKYFDMQRYENRSKNCKRLSERSVAEHFWSSNTLQHSIKQEILIQTYVLIPVELIGIE